MLFNNFVPMQPWRTQVHVLSITPAEHVMDVEVPGWHENDVFQVDTRNVPAAVMNRLWEGDHLYAYVNIGAERT